MSQVTINTSFSLEYKDYQIYKIDLPVELTQNDLEEIDILIRDLLKKKGQNRLFLVANMSRFRHFSDDALIFLQKQNFLAQLNLVAILYGLNQLFRPAMTKLFYPDSTLSVYEVQDEKIALVKARILRSEYLMQTMSSGPVAFTGIDRSTLEINGRKILMVHDRDWEYKHPKETYYYKIDVVDSNIFISRPSGYIEYNNSLTANTIFDKAVLKMIGESGQYYRIQDYTNVVSTALNARREFIQYIAENINRIDLMVFYGLNTVMKTIVKLGKYFNSQFYKVKVVETFDEALILILNHKYGGLYFDNNHAVNLADASLNLPRISDGLKPDSVFDDHNPNLANKIEQLFKDIGNLIKDDDFQKHTAHHAKDDVFSDIYNALYLLKIDINEQNISREKIFIKLQKQLNDLAGEVKAYKKEIQQINRWKNDYLNFTNENFSNMLRNMSIEAETLEIKQILNPKLNTIFDKVFLLNQQINSINDSIFPESKSKSIFQGSMQINQIFEKVVGLHLKAIQSKNLELSVHIDSLIPKYLIGETAKIERILDQFLEIAVEYTNKGSIAVRAKLLNENPGSVNVRLSVHDTGLGIDSKRINNQVLGLPDKLFDIADFASISRLSMSYCSHLAELMGGDVGYFSEPNIGSEFYLDIMLEKGALSKDPVLIKKSNDSEKQLLNETKLKGVLFSPQIESMKVLSGYFNRNSISMVEKIIDIETIDLQDYIDFDFAIISLMNKDENLMEGIKSMLGATLNKPQKWYVLCDADDENFNDFAHEIPGAHVISTSNSLTYLKEKILKDF